MKYDAHLVTTVACSSPCNLVLINRINYSVCFAGAISGEHLLMGEHNTLCSVLGSICGQSWWKSLVFNLLRCARLIFGGKFQNHAVPFNSPSSYIHALSSYSACVHELNVEPQFDQSKQARSLSIIYNGENDQFGIGKNWYKSSFYRASICKYPPYILLLFLQPKFCRRFLL